MSANDDPRYRSIASVRERMRLKRECDGYRRMMDGSIEIPTNRRIKEGIPSRRMAMMRQHMDPDVNENKAVIAQNIRQRERTLSRMSPRHLSRKEKAVVERQIKEDSDWLRKNMGSRKLMATKPTSSNFESAVQSCQREDSKAFQTVANRYKNCMRQIDPDNPNSSNIERLRK